MPCTLGKDAIDRVVAFHGHKCPGLAFGIRAAELALHHVGTHSKDEEIVMITETDMCGVDALQVLIGCTFGKGNLVFMDYGKVAFSFFRRSDRKSLRIVINPLFTVEQEDKEKGFQKVLQANIDDLFLVRPATAPEPSKARIFASFNCDGCQEKVMEVRGRLFKGERLCLPCFQSRFD